MKRMKSGVLFAIMFVGNFLLIHPEQMASADGGKIVFSLDGEIYIIDADGKNLRRLTAHPAWDNWPVWLPDGRHIAFVSDRRGGFSTYTMELAGDNIKKLQIQAIDWLYLPMGSGLLRPVGVCYSWLLTVLSEEKFAGAVHTASLIWLPGLLTAKR